MFPFSRILCLAVARALVAVTAASHPARADELVDNLGPVGPHEPILAWSGSKRIIAFYEPDSGKCATQLVLWDPMDDGKSAAGFQAVINPREMAHIDTSERQSFLLQCDGNAERLVIVDPSTCVKFIRTTQSLRASWPLGAAKGFIAAIYFRRMHILALVITL